MTGAGIGSIVSITLLVTGGFLYVPRVISGYRLRRVLWLALPIVVSGLAMRLAAHGLRVGLASAALSSRVALLVIVAASAAVYAAGLFLTRAVRPDDVRALARLLRRNPRVAEPEESVPPA